MPRLVFKFKSEAADRNIRRVIDRFPNAIRRSVNRAAVSARTYLVKAIASDTGLKQGDVKNEIKVREATLQRLQADVTVSGRPIPLYKFGASGPYPSRGRGRGVRVRIKPPAKGHYPHAFLAMVGGVLRVMERVRPSRSRRGRPSSSPGLPIYELHGPSLPTVFAKHLPEATVIGEESLVKNLQHEFAFALGQTGA